MLTALQRKSEGRFTGTIEPLGYVNITPYSEWLLSIPVGEWHGMTDLTWHGWGERFKPLAAEVLDEHYPGSTAMGHMLFMVEPGQVQLPHRDEQPLGWRVRIHIPVITNPFCATFMDDGPRHMQAGTIFRFNTLAMHGIANLGMTPRVHFIFDVRQ